MQTCFRQEIKDKRPCIADGYVLVAVSTDMMMLAGAARQIVETLKN